MNRMTWTGIAAAAALALPAGAGAVGPKKTPELVERGQASFKKNCASCHGARGEGDGVAAKALNPKPRNLTTQPPPGGAQGVFDALASGKKGTAMIAYKHLPEEERWALAYYVESLKAKK